MEKTSAEIFFSWFEDAWTHGDTVFPGMLPDSLGDAVPMRSDKFRQMGPNGREELTDIRLDFESFESNGDEVTCALVVKARNKVSNEPVAFRAKFDGRVRDGELVSAANAVDYLLAE